MFCFFMNTCDIMMQVKRDRHREDDITQNTKLLRIYKYVLVSNLHIIWHDSLYVFQINKKSIILKMYQTSLELEMIQQ